MGDKVVHYSTNQITLYILSYIIFCDVVKMALGPRVKYRMDRINYFSKDPW